MKAIILAAISMMVVCGPLKSQTSIDSALAMIEKNNTTLLSLKKQVDAQKIKNTTGIQLQNPEVGFNYLWGSPSVEGNRIDFDVMQSFDFPTSYKYKNIIANAQNEQATLYYQKERKTVLLEAHTICIDLVYANILKVEYARRLLHAQTLAASYKSKYDAGDINVLEYNKSQLYLLKAKNEYEKIEIERTAALSQLAALNGGIQITLSDTVFVPTSISTDFEQWYLKVAENNPGLTWIKKENEIGLMQEKLYTALSLPKFSTGYMSEKNVGQQFQGLSIGISIPLFENKNTVKYAKANSLALQYMEADWKLAFYNKLKTLHAKAVSFQKSTESYRLALKSVNNQELLQKALDKGEISLIEYLMEISLYFESVNALLESERDLQKLIVEMTKYE